MRLVQCAPTATMQPSRTTRRRSGQRDDAVDIVEDELAIADAPAARLRTEEFAVEVSARRDGRAVRRKLRADVLRSVRAIGYAFGAPGTQEPER